MSDLHRLSVFFQPSLQSHNNMLESILQPFLSKKKGNVLYTLPDGDIKQHIKVIPVSDLARMWPVTAKHLTGLNKTSFEVFFLHQQSVNVRANAK